MQYRLGIGQRRVQGGQVRAGYRVDQHGPGAVAAQLDQEGPVTIAETRRALGVHGDRPGTPGQRADRLLQRPGRHDQRWQPVPWLQQWLGLRRGRAFFGQFPGRGGLRCLSAGRCAVRAGGRCAVRAGAGPV